MKTACLVTSNESKVLEAKGILTGWHIEHADVDVPEIKSISLEETVKEKAKAAYALLKKPVIVEDTGLFLEAYPSFPGTYTKFCVSLIGLEGILKLLEGKPRGASFRTMVAWCDGNNIKVFEGTSKGTISKTIRKASEKKLPYDSIFMPEGDSRTYSEMTKEEKAKTSHRAKAFLAFAEGMVK